MINVGIIGIGNCASSLVQGVEYYREAADTVGLANPDCAGYAVSEVKFTAAFDVDSEKLDKDLSEAIWLGPNNSSKFAEVPHLGVPVFDGILGDGVGDSVAEVISASGLHTLEAVTDHLRQTGTQILVNFLPVGSQAATELYARAALSAGCGFINCMPATIARSTQWRDRFSRAGVPLIGDDLSSQFGATMVHHALVDVLARNGVRLRRTFQLNHGGNMDFLNMRDPQRLKTKQASKAQGMLGGQRLSPGDVHIGAQYVPFLEDRKVAFIRLEADAFGGTPVEIELRMNVEDSPSAAGNVLDAVRYAKAAMDRGLSGDIAPVSALLMKAPATPMGGSDAETKLSTMFGCS